MAFSAVLDLAGFDSKLGFTVDGPHASAQLGFSVGSAGDVNGDGIDDLILGGPPGAGQAWIIYGNGAGFPASFDVNTLNGANGFTVTGINSSSDNFGYSVSSAGDINNDGFDDLIIGARLAGSPDPGAAWVIYGKANQGAVLSANTLIGSTGFKLTGDGANAQAGRSVASAGDINNDGFDDFLVSSPFHASTAVQTGSVYVVFGKGTAFANNTNLAALDGTNGFEIIGEAQNDMAGWSASSAGDVNNDGFDDILIGAREVTVGSARNAGSAYLIYGKATGYTADLLLSDLTGPNGTQFQGATAQSSAANVASAGDVNGDGFDDMIIGAPGASETGRAYVVFGKAGGFGANVALGDLIESQGFTIYGENLGDAVGSWVSSAGDFNGDGYDDVIVGAEAADASGAQSGGFYMIFGRAGGFTARVNLSELDGSNGFQITPTVGEVGVDSKVSAAGDLNNDGFDDIVVGFGRDRGGLTPLDFPGRSYIIYGGTTFADNVITGTAANQTLNGTAVDDDISGLAGADKLNGLDGDDVLDGGDGADRLTGGLGADTLRGGAGNDYLDGGLGVDVLSGGAGNDVYVVNQVGDTVIEGIDAGYDIVRASIDYVLTAHVEALELQGTGNINGTGNNLGNRMTGTSGDNVLTGGGGGDTLLGGDGNDRLIGGGEGDLLTGGLGADTFVMTNGSLGGVLETDTIFDLIAGQGDIIDLSDIDANTSLAGDQAFTIVSAFSKQAGQLTLTYGSNNITTLRVDVNGDGKVDYQVKVTGDVTGDTAGWIL